MSQEKVDQKKEQKKNIKKIIKQRKVSNIVITVLLSIFIVAVIGWVSYSGYKSYLEAKANAPRESIPINVSGLTTYLNGLITPEDEDLSDGTTTVTSYDADGNVIEGDAGEVANIVTDALEGDANVGSLEEAASVIAADVADNAADEAETEASETGSENE